MTFTHLTDDGKLNMVDVSTKSPTVRTAYAEGKIFINDEIKDAILNDRIKKGNVLTTATVAGIMGAKKVADTIPLCHQLNLSKVDVECTIKENYILVESYVKCEGKTGVEMEALQAVSVALLTIYDMCKAIDKGMIISDIKLLKKTGGKSGTYIRKDD